MGALVAFPVGCAAGSDEVAAGSAFGQILLQCFRDDRAIGGAFRDLDVGDGCLGDAFDE